MDPPRLLAAVGDLRPARLGHVGRFSTLEEVVDFYDKGGHPNPSLDPDIFPLKLTPKEKKDLLAFLRTLEGNAPRVAEPEAPR